MLIFQTAALPATYHKTCPIPTRLKCPGKPDSIKCEHFLPHFNNDYFTKNVNSEEQ